MGVKLTGSIPAGSITYHTSKACLERLRTTPLLHSAFNMDTSHQHTLDEDNNQTSEAGENIHIPQNLTATANQEIIVHPWISSQTDRFTTRHTLCPPWLLTIMPAFSATSDVEMEDPWKHYLLKMHPVRLSLTPIFVLMLMGHTQGSSWFTASLLLH